MALMPMARHVQTKHRRKRNKALSRQNLRGTQSLMSSVLHVEREVVEGHRGVQGVAVSDTLRQEAGGWVQGPSCPLATEEVEELVGAEELAIKAKQMACQHLLLVQVVRDL